MPAAWWPCILMNKINFNSLDEESVKEHVCQIIYESGQYFFTNTFYIYLLYMYSLFSHSIRFEK